MQGSRHDRVPVLHGVPKAVRNGAIAQLGERLNGIQEVVGSIPIGSTNYFKDLVKELREVILRFRLSTGH